MSAERHSLSESFQDDPRSTRSIDLAEESHTSSRSSCDSPARPFLPTTLIPAGPATALAMPPTVHRRVVS